MFATAFLLTGAVMFAIWVVLRKKAKAAVAWPTTRGRILASAIERQRDLDGENADTLRLSYEYSVNGAPLRGNRVSMSGSGSGSSKQKLQRYPAGQEVDVHYDPKNPASAVLECKLPGNILILPLGGLFFLVVGVASAVLLK